MARKEVAIPKKRIGKGMGLLMIVVAIILDAAVVLMLVGGMVFAFAQLGGQACADPDVAKPAIAAYQNSKKILGDGAFSSFVSGVVGALYMPADNINTYKCIGAGGLTISAAFATFPIMAAVISAFAALLSVCIFTVWFYALKVHIWGLKPARIMLHMITCMIESIPVLNLAPMQTINVVGQIYIAKQEDDKHIREAKKNAAAKNSNL